jgi:hypothetical protein
MAIRCVPAGLIVCGGARSCRCRVGARANGSRPADPTHTRRPVRTDPGKPWQNDTPESFNGKFRDECLGME